MEWFPRRIVTLSISTFSNKSNGILVPDSFGGWGHSYCSYILNKLLLESISNQTIILTHICMFKVMVQRMNSPYLKIHYGYFAITLPLQRSTNRHITASIVSPGQSVIHMTRVTRSGSHLRIVRTLISPPSSIRRIIALCEAIVFGRCSALCSNRVSLAVSLRFPERPLQLSSDCLIMQCASGLGSFRNWNRNHLQHCREERIRKH